MFCLCNDRRPQSRTADKLLPHLHEGLQGLRIQHEDTYKNCGKDEENTMETTEIKIRTCPICGTAYRGHPAISRTDNETPICSDCGTRESLQDIGISDEEIEKIIEIIHRNVDRKL